MSVSNAMVSFAGDFDIQSKAPLDARTKQDCFDDFENRENWVAKDGNVYLFEGIIVQAKDENGSLREYRLEVKPSETMISDPSAEVESSIKRPNYCWKSNWYKIGTLL